VRTAVRELVRSRDVFVTLVERQLKLRAKRSWISTAWPVVAPLVLMLLYLFVFKRVFRVPIERYPVYLLSGLLPWVFLSQTLSKATTSISTEAHLVRKAPFPYELMPISTVLAQAVNFLLTIGLFMAALMITGDLPLSTLPVLPVPIAAVMLLVMALSIVLALIDVYNHDLRYVLGNVLTIWFFLVPIVYRPRMVPRAAEVVQSFDPVTMIVGQFRAVLYRGHIEDPVGLVLMLLVCGVVFCAALLLFRRLAPQLAKDI
jgi:lipopolysaccharide transport system permease protein